MDEAMQAEQQGGAQAPAAAQPPGRPPVEIELVRDDARMRLWRHRGKSDRLVVCFSGVGRDRRQPPRLEFARIAAQSGRDHVLYFADPQRSWLNAPGLIEDIAALVEAEAARLGVAHVVAMGHSLGGFSALVLGGFTKVDVALALSPQLSIDPALVPDEPRWMMFRKHIETIRIRQAADHMQETTLHYVIFGRDRREAPQRALLRPAPNVQSFELPRVRHDSVMRLYQAGILEDVVRLAFARRTRKLRQVLQAQMRGVHLNTPLASEETET